MKYRSLLLCLSILVMFFTGCSSSQQSAEQAAVAEQLAAAEQARTEAEQAVAAAEQIRAAAEQARIAAEQAMAAAKKANSAAQMQAAAEQAKAAEQARAEAEQRTSAAAKKAKARAEDAEQARAAAKKANVPTITLAAGTPVNVITTSEISTKTGNAGDAFEVLLNEDIADGGRVIARRGSVVKGVITESDPGGRVKGVATMSLQLTGLTLASGGQLSIRTNDYIVEAKSSVGKDVTKTGIGAGIGAAIGAIAGGGKGAAIGAGIGGAAGATTALATRGDPAVIASETPITFDLAAPVTIAQPQDGGRRR